MNEYIYLSYKCFGFVGLLKDYQSLQLAATGDFEISKQQLQAISKSVSNIALFVKTILCAVKEHTYVNETTWEVSTERKELIECLQKITGETSESDLFELMGIFGEQIIVPVKDIMQDAAIKDLFN